MSPGGVLNSLRGWTAERRERSDRSGAVQPHSGDRRSGVGPPSPRVIGPRFLVLARARRTTRRRRPRRRARRGVAHRRPRQFAIAGEERQAAVELRTHHHAIARLHVLGGRTWQLQEAVVPAHGPVGLHHAPFLQREHAHYTIVRCRESREKPELPPFRSTAERQKLRLATFPCLPDR